MAKRLIIVAVSLLILVGWWSTPPRLAGELAGETLPDDLYAWLAVREA